MLSSTLPMVCFSSGLVCHIESAVTETNGAHGPVNGFNPSVHFLHPSPVLHPIPAKPSPVDLGVGEYRVGRRINRVFRDLRYTIDEVIPTRDGKTLLVINPSLSELFSGYHESCFPEEPVGFLPLVGPIEGVTFGGQDVSDRVVLAARELLHQIIPSHGGRFSG